MTQVEAIKAQIEYLKDKPWAEEELARLYLELEKAMELEEALSTKAEVHSTPESKLLPRNYTKSVELQRERIRAGLATGGLYPCQEDENGKT